MDDHPGRGHVGDLDGVVLRCTDRLRQVEPHLRGINVEGRHEFDVRDVVVPELDVHQAAHPVRGVSIRVMGHTLDQRRCTVADADDGDANLAHLFS